ncbi:uncharacterized protein LOC143600178 [Bidens hawaiensis]|uniref:uncharacterized protein LOC143600178 n=1 Tax=Bidens hawaiensis TaxID=980011 RepID=UPI00404AC337
MMTGPIQDQHLDKQIGCMSGFLHIFDRQQILAGKRIHSTKRLPASTVSPSVTSPETKKPVVNSPENAEGLPPSPAANSKFFPTSTPPRSPLPLPIMPRLSLDSRATVDSKGSLRAKEIQPDSVNGSFEKQRRSPSVIAKLMGLDQLPSSDSSFSSPETVKTPELRRSASESRVSRDLFQSRFSDCNNFPAKQTNQTNKSQLVKTITEPVKHSLRNQKNELSKTNQWRYSQQSQRRSFFDSADIFPEPKQTISGKNLRLRGVDEQSKDLEALKHILEAMQLKGLLHSINRDSHRNFVYDSNAILMNHRRCSPRSPSNRRYSAEFSPRKERGVFDRSGRSPVRFTNSPINCNTNDKRKAVVIETQNRYHESTESRRISPVNSPKLTPKRTGSERHSVVTDRSPRSKRPSEKIYSKAKVSRIVVTEDELSSVSESSGSTNSHFDPERSKPEECREGKSLLARCDKLLAEMNSITSSNSVLPSPVSVLDSAFDKDEASSPSPVKKRTIDFKDVTVTVDLEDDDIRSSIISPATSNEDEDFISGDSDFTYISKILRALKYLPDESSVFYFLEKQCHNENESSTGSKLQRKLVFDVVTEILRRNRDLPQWNAISLTESSNAVKQICTEFKTIREPETADNLLDLICTVLKKDLAGNNGWGDHPVEVAESVLYIERLIFKDLVSETIGDLVEFAGKTTFCAPRRKLVFNFF